MMLSWDQRLAVAGVGKLFTGRNHAGAGFDHAQLGFRSAGLGFGQTGFKLGAVDGIFKINLLEIILRHWEASHIREQARAQRVCGP